MSDSNTNLSSQLLSLRERVSAGLTNISSIESRLSEHVGSTNAHRELFSEKASIAAVEETNTTLADLENRVSLLKNTVDALIGSKSGSSFLGYPDTVIIENRFNQTINLDVPPIDDDPENAVTYTLYSGEFMEGITFDATTGTITTVYGIENGEATAVVLVKSGTYGKFVIVKQRYFDLNLGYSDIVNRLRSGDIENLVGTEFYMYLVNTDKYEQDWTGGTYQGISSSTTSQKLVYNGVTYSRYASGDTKESVNGVNIWKKVCWSCGSGNENKIYTNNFAITVGEPVFNHDGIEIGSIEILPDFMVKYKVVVTDVDTPDVENLSGYAHFARIEFVNAPIQLVSDFSNHIWKHFNKSQIIKLITAFENQRIPSEYKDNITSVNIFGVKYDNFIIPSTLEYTGNIPATQVNFSFDYGGGSASNKTNIIPVDGSPVTYNNVPSVLHNKTRGVSASTVPNLLTRDAANSFKDGVPLKAGSLVYITSTDSKCTINYDCTGSNVSAFYCAPAFYIA